MKSQVNDSKILNSSVKGDIKNCTSVISQYAQLVASKIEELKNQMALIDDKIEKLYDGMKAHKYRLQSVLVHDGVAQLGHYYSYIFDFFD